MRLKDRVALITGAGHGIGRAIALRFAEEGARIAIADINPEWGRQTAAMIEAGGGQALAIEMDVSRHDQVEATVARVIQVFGQIDILVNDAGIMGRVSILEMTEAEWDRMLDVNLKGQFLCTQAAAREMIKAGRPGRIINLGSIESEAACPEQAHYAASKGGVLMLTRALALDLARYHINVNAIGPGTTDSGHGSFADPAKRAKYDARIPWGRIAEPRDIAGAALFLASDDAAYVTGTILYVDGGCIIRYHGVD